MDRPQKLVVIGAGPVGALAALYGAQRGYDVEIYELRPDLRDKKSIPLNFTKSINLALSERGIHALRQTGRPDILEDVMRGAIPMRGRMIHGRTSAGDLFDDAQDYDIFGRTIFAADRNELNSKLLDKLLNLPNVKVFFNHKLTGVDFKTCKAWLEVKDQFLANGRHKEIEIDFDFMIGADGAHSATRYHIMKFARVDYQQEFIDTMWCEFRMEAVDKPANDAFESKFRISPYHLHIWPGRDFMFIAIPNEDGSFTCTLFMPQQQFTDLEANPAKLGAFFDTHFPGVRDHIPDDALFRSFKENPHLPLISIKCKPYHFGSSGVILGDAAHAMVPFYGQGMNAGFEDVRILFSILDKHAELDETNSPADVVSVSSPAAQRAQALAEYSAVRAPDAHTINDLAITNYIEMRSSVLSRTYRLRKWLEEFMSVHFSSFGWQTKYSRVTFSSERYSQIVAQNNHQSHMLMRWVVGLVSSPFVVTGLIFAYRCRRTLSGGLLGR